MDTSETGTAAEKCHRCLVPVPPKAVRCPRCGEPVHRSHNIRKILAVFGLLMFLAIAAVAYRMMQISGAPSAGASDEQAQRPGAPDKAPPPEKKPALGE
jgi:uncharacterized paraquat-inducible protein A